MSKTILITGATRGLGLAIAQTLDRETDASLVLAVRDPRRGAEVASTLTRRHEVVGLDVSSLDEVRSFTEAWSRPLDGLVNNAGLQVTGPVTFTREGIEETIATNHLGPAWLTLGLARRLRGAHVVSIGSGTHNPEHPTAPWFGFRGGIFTSIDELARGGWDAKSDRLRGAGRYATSKLLSTVWTLALARRLSRAGAPTFLPYTLDPGLMPGTDLARTAPAIARWFLATVMRWLVPLLPDASTPARSASALRRLLEDPSIEPGEVYDFDAARSKHVWPRARDIELGERVFRETIAFASARAPMTLPSFVDAPG